MKVIVRVACLAVSLGGLTAVSAAIAQGTAAATAATSTTAGADFPAGPQRALAVKSCTACHASSQVTSQHKSAAQWAETVNHMIGFGAPVAEEEFDPLVAYLAHSFGDGSVAK